jgi:hypothetical protein
VLQGRPFLAGSWAAADAPVRLPPVDELRTANAETAGAVRPEPRPSSPAPWKGREPVIALRKANNHRPPPEGTETRIIVKKGGANVCPPALRGRPP